MLTVKIILLCITVYLACYLAGALVCPERDKKTPGLKMVYGLMTLWALFFVIAVVYVVMQLTAYDQWGFVIGKLFWKSQNLIITYEICASAVMIAGIAKVILDLVKGGKAKNTGTERTPVVSLDRTEMVLLGLFLALVIFQLVKSVFFAFADGDDSYYVSVAQFMADGESTMYKKEPYTGYPTDIQFRYGLAPFPLWVGFLAALFSLNAATVAHICMPLILIPITYVIYNAVGKLLFGSNKTGKYVFLCLVAVFVLFSCYSINPAEVFLLTRARQGKEALANIVIPLLFYDMFSRASSEELKFDAKNYILIILIELSGALTSVFGNILILIMLFANFIYGFYRKADLRYKIMSALLALPPAIIVVLYYLL